VVVEAGVVFWLVQVVWHGDFALALLPGWVHWTAVPLAVGALLMLGRAWLQLRAGLIDLLAHGEAVRGTVTEVRRTMRGDRAFGPPYAVRISRGDGSDSEVVAWRPVRSGADVVLPGMPSRPGAWVVQEGGRLFLAETRAAFRPHLFRLYLLGAVTLLVVLGAFFA